ncbi:MAG: hypothetical protein O9308_04460 [Beijerinckiaceae bacterium]|nr:hypothetical protein [Beijerinckiaceae bacterium]
MFSLSIGPAWRNYQKIEQDDAFDAAKKFDEFLKIFNLEIDKDLLVKVNYLIDIRDLFYHYDFGFEDNHNKMPKVVYEFLLLIEFDTGNYLGWDWQQMLFQAGAIDIFEKCIRDFFRSTSIGDGDDLNGRPVVIDKKIETWGIDNQYKSMNWLPFLKE